MRRVPVTVITDLLGTGNPAALRETVTRFQEAIRRGLWSPRSNSATDLINKLLPQQQRESAA